MVPVLVCRLLHLSPHLNRMLRVGLHQGFSGEQTQIYQKDKNITLNQRHLKSIPFASFLTFVHNETAFLSCKTELFENDGMFSHVTHIETTYIYVYSGICLIYGFHFYSVANDILCCFALFLFILHSSKDHRKVTHNCYMCCVCVILYFLTETEGSSQTSNDSNSIFRVCAELLQHRRKGISFTL